MASWEEQWISNRRAMGGQPVPSGLRGPQARFGADPSVHVVSAPQPMVVPAQGGGTFSNAVLLVLGGFAVGTLWGEPLINKMMGVKHGQ